MVIKNTPIRIISIEFMADPILISDEKDPTVLTDRRDTKSIRKQTKLDRKNFIFDFTSYFKYFLI